MYKLPRSANFITEQFSKHAFTKNAVYWRASKPRWNNRNCRSPGLQTLSSSPEAFAKIYKNRNLDETTEIAEAQCCKRKAVRRRPLPKLASYQDVQSSPMTVQANISLQNLFIPQYCLCSLIQIIDLTENTWLAYHCLTVSFFSTDNFPSFLTVKKLAISDFCYILDISRY